MVGLIATGTNHFELIGAIFISFATAVVTRWQSRKKEHTSQFTVFMKESADYRHELREDQKSLKDQLKTSLHEAEKLQHLLDTAQEQIEKDHAYIKSLEIKLADANFEIGQLRIKIQHLQEIQLIIKEKDE